MGTQISKNKRVPGKAAPEDFREMKCDRLVSPRKGKYGRKAHHALWRNKPLQMLCETSNVTECQRFKSTSVTYLLAPAAQVTHT